MPAWLNSFWSLALNRGGCTPQQANQGLIWELEKEGNSYRHRARYGVCCARLDFDQVDFNTLPSCHRSALLTLCSRYTYLPHVSLYVGWIKTTVRKQGMEMSAVTP
jgi:hypothetical protein